MRVVSSLRFFPNFIPLTFMTGTLGVGIVVAANALIDDDAEEEEGAADEAAAALRDGVENDEASWRMESGRTAPPDPAAAGTAEVDAMVFNLFPALKLYSFALFIEQT
jgi:hypothetical protein